MDAVAEVDVDGPAGAVEHLGALRAAAVRVAGCVLLAAVDFGLGDEEAALAAVGIAAHQDLAEQLGRDIERVTGEKSAAKSHRLESCLLGFESLFLSH